MRCALFSLVAILISGPSWVAAESPLAWIRLSQQPDQQYEGMTYWWLADAPICLTMDVAPTDGLACDLLWGALTWTLDQHHAEVVHVLELKEVVHPLIS